jgi:hypothetical protein
MRKEAIATSSADRTRVPGWPRQSRLRLATWLRARGRSERLSGRSLRSDGRMPADSSGQSADLGELVFELAIE